MPRGGQRPGAGRPAKPVELHRLQGTFRPSRHGHLAAAARRPAEFGWSPTAADRAELGARALDWLDAVVTLYRLDAIEGRLLMAALRSLTRVGQLEARIAADGVAPDGPHPLLAALCREQRQFLSLWAHVGLGKH